jgi:hypothetical protein
MATVKQVKDWIEHPEKYDIEKDDDFVRFQAWIILIAELNGLIDESGNEVTTKKVNRKKMKHPTPEQVLARVNVLRGRLN